MHNARHELVEGRGETQVDAHQLVVARLQFAHVDERVLACARNARETSSNERLVVRVGAKV